MAAPRPSVSKEVFLEAALTIADQFGPDALSTRSLGNAVGLDATTDCRQETGQVAPEITDRCETSPDRRL